MLFVYDSRDIETLLAAERSRQTLAVYSKTAAPIQAPPISAPTRGMAVFMTPAPVLEGSAVDVVSMADVVMADVPVLVDVMDVLDVVGVVELDLLDVLDVPDMPDALDALDVLDRLDVLDSGDVLDSPDELVVAAAVLVAEVLLMPDTLAGPTLTVGSSVLDGVAVSILTSLWFINAGASSTRRA